MKDKRNHHGEVGKSSLKQHFRKSAAITFTVRNFWSSAPSAVGLASWLADKIQVNFENFGIHYRLTYVRI